MFVWTLWNPLPLCRNSKLQIRYDICLIYSCLWYVNLMICGATLPNTDCFWTISSFWLIKSWYCDIEQLIKIWKQTTQRLMVSDNFKEICVNVKYFLLGFGTTITNMLLFKQRCPFSGVLEWHLIGGSALMRNTSQDISFRERSAGAIMRLS